MKMPNYFGSLILLHVLLFAVVTTPLAAQLNSITIRRDSQLELKPESELKLGDEATIEFWVGVSNTGQRDRLQDDAKYAGDRLGSNGKFKSSTELFAYRPLISSGTEQDLDFAVILATEPETGQAMLGVINSFEDVGQEDRFTYLTKIDGFGEIAPLVLERKKSYHIAISKTSDREWADIYVDGVSQGDLRCNLGSPSKSSLVLGAEYEPHSVEKSDKTIAQAFKFNGDLGGLRIWKKGLSEMSIVALHTFGPGCDPHELTMILEYSQLLAYGDFQRDFKQCKLRTPMAAIGGVWRSKFAKVIRNYQSSGKFLDFPVYTFVPTDGETYAVFEDSQSVGTMTRADPADSNVARWRFQHSDPGWQPIEFTMGTETVRGRPKTILQCDLLPNNPRPFAGEKQGSLTLVRGSLDASGAGFTTGTFFNKIQSVANKTNEDLTTVFLMNNNLRYKDVLYCGYNVTGMDGLNLFNSGVNRKDNFLFASPEKGLYEINANQFRIIPVDLEISNSNMGDSRTDSTIISNSEEYSRAITKRIGGGVNGSISASAKAGFLGSGVEVTGTVNMHVVAQGENLDESVSIDSSTTEKMVSVSTFEHYDLYHQKDRTRLSKGFRDELLNLYQKCKGASAGEKKQYLNQFFNNWGTHYVFGGTFGAIKWAERTLDQTQSSELIRDMWGSSLKVNDGDTGRQNDTSNKLTNAFTKGTLIVRNVGGNSASDENSPAGPGDEPAPIRLDMRPVAELLSPQYFPNNPQIYQQLREWIELAYPQYLLDQFESKLNGPALAKRFTPEQLDKYKTRLRNYLVNGSWDETPRQIWIELVNAEFQYPRSKDGYLAPKNTNALLNSGLYSVPLTVEGQGQPTEKKKELSSQEKYQVAFWGARGNLGILRPSTKQWTIGGQPSSLPGLLIDARGMTHLTMGGYETFKFAPDLYHDVHFDLGVDSSKTFAPQFNPEILAHYRKLSKGKFDGVIAEMEKISARYKNREFIKLPTELNKIEEITVEHLAFGAGEKFAKCIFKFKVARVSNASGLFDQIGSEMVSSSDSALGSIRTRGPAPQIDRYVNRSKIPQPVGVSRGPQGQPNAGSTAAVRKPVPPTVPSAPPLVVIKLDTGLKFQQEADLRWAEYDANNKPIQYYSETKRDGEMIELHAVNKQMRVHIYPDRIIWDQPGMAAKAMKGNVVK